MQEFLLVVQNIAGNLRTSKTAHLDTNLRIVGQKPQSVKHLSGLSKLAVVAQTQPVQDVADVLARINDHRITRLGELLPWNWKPATVPQDWAA